MKTKDTLLLIILIMLLVACSKDEVQEVIDTPNAPIGYSSLIDPDDVVGTLDPWILIDEPQYKSVAQVSHLDSANQVLLYKGDSHVYVYSLTNMFVEVVNDMIDNIPVAITYCPQTMSGICWNRIIGNDTMSLAASGLLYRENQMPYDYQTNSIWSQMLLLGVRGKHINQNNSTFSLIETNWDMVVKHFPNARVYTNEGDVGGTAALKIDHLVLGDKYYGVIGLKQVTIFNYDQFNKQDIEVKNTAVSGQGMSVVGSYNKHFIVAYTNTYQMQALQGEFPNVMIDETGTKWNIFGEATSGLRLGERLQSPDGYVALGWAWEALFESVVVY